ncbi:hypothetical protein ACFVHQ_04580 [Actinomycetes bacterium NPDC127524]
MAKVIVLHADKFEKTVEELYEDFQLENRVKNLSEMTIRFYEQNIIHFLRYLDGREIKLVSEVEKKIIDIKSRRKTQ